MKRNPIPRAQVRARQADRAYDSKLRDVQQALGELLVERGASGAPNVHMNSMRNDLARMAGSDAALTAMKIGLPVAVAAAPAIDIGDDESYANQAMDLLGMGVGAYGMNYGINKLGGTTAAGAQLNRYQRGAAMGGSALASLALMDAAQLLLGGGKG